MHLGAGREEAEAMTLLFGEEVSTEKPRAMTRLAHMCSMFCSSVLVPEQLKGCRDLSRGACHGVMDLRNAGMCFAHASDDGFMKFSTCNPSNLFMR